METNKLVSFFKFINEQLYNPENKWILWLIIIFGISFRIISVSHGISFDSDQAIHVLMIDRFEIIRDNYYWGQNYLGSLFPMVGSFIKFFTGIDSIYIALFLQYICLITTFLICTKLFIKDKSLKVLFAVAMLFPPSNFWHLVFVGSSFLSSFPVFFISVYFLFRFIESLESMVNLGDLVKYFVFCFLAGWVNEYFFYINFLNSVLLLTYVLVIQRNFTTKNDKFKVGLYIFLGNIGFVLVRNYLKLTNVTSYSPDGYGKLNTFSEFVTTFSIYFNMYVNSLFNFNLYSVISLVAIFTLLVILIVDIVNQKTNSSFINLKTFTLLYLLLSYLGATFLSNWTLRQDDLASVRYFSGAYFFFILLFFNVCDIKKNISQNIYTSKILFSICFCLIFFGSSQIVNEFIKLKYRPSSALDLNEQLIKHKIQNATIIGGYWETHIFTGASSSRIISAVSDKDNLNKNRDDQYRKIAIASQEIYFVRNRLFDIFPDTIYEFGSVYTKNNELPITINYKVDFYLQKYKNESYVNGKYNKVFNSDYIYSWTAHKQFDSILKVQTWNINMKGIKDNKELLHVFTPLAQGEHELKFTMYMSDPSKLSSDISIKLSNNKVQEELASYILSKDSIKAGYNFYKLKLNIKNDADEGLLNFWSEKANGDCDFKIARIDLIQK